MTSPTVPSTPRTDNADSRPNILYIFTDQQWGGAMSCTGNPELSTPALDALAAEGVRYDRAYCTSPVCSPSRASMFTGLMPHQHGVIKNDILLQDESVLANSLSRRLTDQGYHCAYAGKWHLGTYKGISEEENRQHPYEVLANWEDTTGLQWEGEDRLDWDHGAIQNVTESCVDFLKRDHTTPFFLVASYDCPHEICGWPSREERILPDSLEDCPDQLQNFDIPEGEASVLRDVYMSRHPEQHGLTPDDWRQYLWAYYRYVERADAAIGRLLETLKAQGLDENTLIVFSSDHGDGMGAHQWLGKCVHYDEVIRVPMIVRHPDRRQAGTVDNQRLVSNGPDFYTTALDYAGLRQPDGYPGQSLRAGSKDLGRDGVVSEIWIAGPGSGDDWAGDPFGRVLCTERYKYAIYEWGEQREQLFDLKEDPGEMHSLTDQADAQGILQEHRQRLAAWCRETGDSKGTEILESCLGVC